MKSQLRIVMHPSDEALVIDELLRDSDVVLINGPRWQQAVPMVTRRISEIEQYCIIWSPKDLSELTSEYMPKQNDWYCRSEFATIQFLRCSLHQSVLTEGRFAIFSDGGSIETTDGVDRRFKLLRRLIQKKFVNSVVCWRNPSLSDSSASLSANPIKLDSSLWVGPVAFEWLSKGKERRVKQFLTSSVEGSLGD
jgi:hypothetical protein